VIRKRSSWSTVPSRSFLHWSGPRVKPIDPAAPKLRFQLSDGSVDLMKSFRLDGFDGVGGAWKIPSTDETFDARYGRW